MEECIISEQSFLNGYFPEVNGIDGYQEKTSARSFNFLLITMRAAEDNRP